MSIQDLQQNPQDTSNFYLANIYQATIADPNRSNISSSLPASPPPFSPPTFAVWVNSLWFSSLVISVTCALLATLLQQWARRYLKVTQTRSSLHKRARIRSFFAEGVDKSHFSMVVEALPTLIHVSVSLFFAGLVVFLWNVNLTMFKAVMSLIGICTVVYGCITLIPIFRHDSPYYSPLTPLARPVVGATLVVFVMLYYGFFRLVLRCSSCFSCSGPVRLVGYLSDWLVQLWNVIQLTPEKAALKSSSEIDARAMMWTSDSLDEDHELERFFSGLPGFQRSKLLQEPLNYLNEPQKLRLLEAEIRLLDRTYSSDFLTDQVKHQRADICVRAIELVDTPNAFSRLVRRLVSEDGYGPVQSTQIVDFIRRWGNRKLDHNSQYSALVQAMFSIVVVRVQRHDDSWFNLASEELGISVTALREYATHGTSLSFAILIYVTRLQFTHIRNTSWPDDTISEVLGAASKFNVHDTLPGLQHEFCALWNQTVREAHNGPSEIPEHILRPIRNLYITLHEGTNSAPTRFSSTTGDDNINLWALDAYPECNVPGHIHNDSVSTALAPIVPHDDPALSLTSLVTPVALSSPLTEPFHVDETPTTVPRDDNSYPTRRTIENLHVPVTSPDPASAGVMRDQEQNRVVVTPTPQPATPPVPQTLPMSVSSAPALDNTVLTGPLLSYLSLQLHLTSHCLIA